MLHATLLSPPPPSSSPNSDDSDVSSISSAIFSSPKEQRTYYYFHSGRGQSSANVMIMSGRDDDSIDEVSDGAKVDHDLYLQYLESM